MPWKPIDPARAERERMRRKAMEAGRPTGHNRAYKNAHWLKLRVQKLLADPRRPRSITSMAIPGTIAGKTSEALASRATRHGRCVNRFAGRRG